MSSVVTAKCPNCKHVVSVEEELSELPATCAECQATFIPAMIIAESNRRFEMGMYVVMLAIGCGLIGYMALTRKDQPNGETPAAPPAAESTSSK